MLWVNSAGNYRPRHWEGAWSDADGDGNLDVPGDGNAFGVDLAATSRPACDISWAGANAADTGSYYHLELYQDAALTVPALDKRTGLPIQSSGLDALPDPHADMPPGAIATAGHYYVAVRRVGNAAADAADALLPHGPLADGGRHGLELPHAGRCARRLLGRRVRRHDAAAGVLLVRGPDRRRPPQARHRGAHERPHHARRSRVGGDQRLRRHLVRDAPRRRCGRPDLGRGGGRRRRRQRRPARARPPRRAGARRRRAGPDTVFGAGRLRLDLAAPVLGTPQPADGATVRGTVALALPITDEGTLGLLQLTVDGTPLVATLAPGGILQASWPTAGLAPGPHLLELTAADLSGNVATYRLTLNVDNDAPRVRLRAPLHADQGDKVRISASVRDAGSGLAGRPRIEFGDGAGAYGFRLAHRYERAGRYVVTMRATDRAGNTTLVQRTLRVRVPRRAGRPGSRPGVDWRRDHRRRHDGSRPRGGPRDTDESGRLLGAAQAAHHAADRRHDDRLARAGGPRLARQRARRSGRCSAWRSSPAARARSTTGTTATSTR